MSTKEELIKALEQYQNNEISGQELETIWKDAPDEIYIVYYNLLHLISDEDIRKKDAHYAQMQFQQLKVLISALKANASEDILARFNFLYTVNEKKYEKYFEMIKLLTPPFWAFESGSIYIFENLQKLQSTLEATDIKNSEYMIFDNQGNLLKIGIKKETEKFLFFNKQIYSIDIDNIKIIANQFDKFSQLIKNYFAAISNNKINNALSKDMNHEIMTAYILGVEGYGR